MTSFTWEIPPAMVVSIPKEIDSRNEKFAFIASQLRHKQIEILEEEDKLEEQMIGL